MRQELYPIPHTLYPSSRALRAGRRGQSIVEAVIAISILTTGFLGIASLLARSYFLSRVISDQVTANYLAAEGIEIAKNLIDHDVYEALSGNTNYAWGSCFSHPNAGSGEEEVELDYTTTDCSNLPAFNLPGDPLQFDPVMHLYGYNLPPGDNPVATNFTREILVTENGSLITVDSIVRWSTATVVNQSLRLEDTFYNWRG